MSLTIIWHISVNWYFTLWLAHEANSLPHDHQHMGHNVMAVNVEKSKMYNWKQGAKENFRWAPSVVSISGGLGVFFEVMHDMRVIVTWRDKFTNHGMKALQSIIPEMYACAWQHRVPLTSTLNITMSFERQSVHNLLKLWFTCKSVKQTVSVRTDVQVNRYRLVTPHTNVH